VSRSSGKTRWGKPPWKIDFHGIAKRLPREVDFAVVGGGFTGLAAAAWLRRLAPHRGVSVFEAGQVGAGSSGRTGGLTLAETAVGDLPSLGDVLAGFSQIVSALEVKCDLDLGGVYELVHRHGGDNHRESPISWKDDGNLHVARTVPGGSVDPGKLVSGLARAAHRLGAKVFENSPVDAIAFERSLRLVVNGKEIHAQRVLVATNAMSLELSGLAGQAHPKFTLAVATEALSDAQIEALGLISRRPFYTIDLPYLWGRFWGPNRIVFGSGLVHLQDWRELAGVDVEKGVASKLIAHVIRRVHGLHPCVRRLKFTHRWGGPMLVARDWKPVFARHPRSPNVFVLGAYSGHGVALSVYLGRWAAEVLLKRKSLPKWGRF
jgi:glycine/D-amino acid oxidase-like deaminating enzyme